MRPLCPLIRRVNLPFSPSLQWHQHRCLLTLAIETSCDDTSVAVLEKHKNNSATLHFHETITSDNRSFQGVHPIIAHESHQKNLATLINQALQSLPIAPSPTSDPSQELAVVGNNGVEIRRKPDFVTVTRGPGMRASLTTGVDTAKGLAVAWQVPLLGVHHMQAHALTPRLVSAIDAVKRLRHETQKLRQEVSAEEDPAFPFLTLLVSGGHTMLVHSKSLCDHKILADTTDMAIGDMIDKAAREILPPSYLKSGVDVMYGRLLERFTFPDPNPNYNYVPPTSYLRPREAMEGGYGWKISPPYSTPGVGGPIQWAGSFTFSGMGSAVKAIMAANPNIDEHGRRELGRETMALAFEHLASRVLFALKRPEIQDIKTLVVSGGVARNRFLEVVLRQNLDFKGGKNVKLVFPPARFCTDNAAMIAWTGIEMSEAGWRSSLEIQALRKWSIDPSAEDGGILGIDGWERAEIIAAQPEPELASASVSYS